MRSARLLGRDQSALGAVAAIAEGRAAITLSLGGALKTYHHTDPNEDAACFALGAGGMLAAAVLLSLANRTCSNRSGVLSRVVSNASR